MKLTKAQRHELYKAVLKENDLSDGICIDLAHFVRQSGYPNFYIDGISSTFPELMKHKPIDAQVYWFPDTVNGKKQRIEVLKQCIRETSPKKKSKGKVGGIQP